MNITFEDLILAFGLMMVIEGTMYALFAEGMKKTLMSIGELSKSNIQLMGLIVAFLGLMIILYLR